MRVLPRLLTWRLDRIPSPNLMLMKHTLSANWRKLNFQSVDPVNPVSMILRGTATLRPGVFTGGR